MDFMMNRYEAELKKPIRNLVNGQLARYLLIQVNIIRLSGPTFAVSHALTSSFPMQVRVQLIGTH